MPLDSVFLSALAEELRSALVGSRVDKIFMPGRDEVLFALRGGAAPVRLLLSAGRMPRVHITQVSRENPVTPPMFCMLLRKHLSSARLSAIRQPDSERILLLTFDATDEMGVACQKTLAAEIMGRHSNLILYGEDERILGCLKRVDMEMSERRQVLPGLRYHLPPTQDKRNPFETDEALWRTLIAERPKEKPFSDWLLGAFSCLPPLVCRELAARVTEESDEAFLQSVLAWRRDVLERRFAPWLLTKNDLPFEFSYMPIRQYGALALSTKVENYSSLLDFFYSERDRLEQLGAEAQGTKKRVSTLLERAIRKLAVQQTEFASTQNRERLREYADLLMANLHAIRPGQSAVTVANFYHEDEPVSIALRPEYTPHQNAERYYRDYRKAKNAEKTLSEQMAQTQGEIVYLESVKDALWRAISPQDLREINDELTQGGYLKAKKKGATRPTKTFALDRFVSSTHVPILAGRNNRQNDLLTMKTAARGDMWFHAQKIPGSHVVAALGGAELDDATLLEAATLAATLSGASESPKVPVDYTRVSRVKKPPGAKPGMVTYSDFKTILVTPDKALLRTLRG